MERGIQLMICPESGEQIETGSYLLIVKSKSDEAIFSFETIKDAREEMAKIIIGDYDCILELVLAKPIEKYSKGKE